MIYLIMAFLLGLLYYSGNFLMPVSDFNIPVFYVEILALVLALFFLVKKQKIYIDKNVFFF